MCLCFGVGNAHECVVSEAITNSSYLMCCLTQSPTGYFCLQFLNDKMGFCLMSLQASERAWSRSLRKHLRWLFKSQKQPGLDASLQNPPSLQ